MAKIETPKTDRDAKPETVDRDAKPETVEARPHQDLHGDAAQVIRALVELDRSLAHAGRPQPALLRAAELLGVDLAARILAQFEGDSPDAG